MLFQKEIRFYKKYELGKADKIANFLLKKSNGKIYLCIDRLFYESKKDDEIVNTIDYYIELFNSGDMINIYDGNFLENGKYYPKYRIVQKFTNQYYNYTLLEIDCEKSLNFFISAGFLDSIIHIFSGNFLLSNMDNIIKTFMKIPEFGYIDSNFFEQLEEHFQDNTFMLYDMLDSMDCEGYLCLTKIKGANILLARDKDNSTKLNLD